MPARTPALPAAPAPKPSPPASPASPAKSGAVPPPASDPSPPPANTDDVSSGMQDIGTDFANMDRPLEDRPTLADKPKPPAKPDVKAPEKPKGEEIKAPETKPEEAPRTPAQLRNAFDALKKERDEVWHPRAQKAENELKRLQGELERVKTTTSDPKPLQERITTLETQNKALLEEVRYANYAKHPEFQEKYVKPYDENWAKAVHEFNQLNIQLADGSVRKANESDLLALANAPLDQLDDLAETQFGKSAPRVIRHIERIRDLAEAQQKALEDARKGAGDHAKAIAEQARKQNGAFQGAYDGAKADILAKYPNWFAPAEGDEPGNELLKKGFDFADTVLGPNGSLTPQQKAGRLAVIRAKAANHDRLVSKIKTANARIAELESQLKDYEKSAPPTDDAGIPGTIEGASWIDNADVAAELQELERKNRR